MLLLPCFMKKFISIISIFIAIARIAAAQDTLKQQQTNLHFQQTIITQYKPSFNAPYSGKNSLSTKEETQSSIR